MSRTASTNRRPSSWIESALGNAVVYAAVATVLWIVAVRQAKFDSMGLLGLITVLKWPYFAGLGVLALGFAVELLRTPLRERQLFALSLVLILYLFGTSSAIAPTASLGDSWLHANFVHYFIVHGHSLINYDARFSWPGAFSLAAVVAGFAGKSNALAFLRWFPLFIEFLYLFPVVVIARNCGVGRRAGWLGVALFFASDWIYQDYFSPQALNLLFYLVVIATVLAGWRAKQSKAIASKAGLGARFEHFRESLSRRRIKGEDASQTWDNTTTTVVIGLLSLICLASAISHQLTPFALILALSGLILTRRLGRPELLFIAALFTVGWLSLGATNFWLGHLTLIFGSVGSIGSTLGANVSNRVTGSSSHLLIVEARILVIAALYSLAGLGVLRRAASTRSLEILAGLTFVLVAAQSYGGEGLMRVVLFALPFTSMLAASAIFPTGVGRIRPILPRPRIGRFTRVALRCAVVAVLMGFTIGTTLTRGGNDAYESFSRGEVAAVTYAYDHVRPGQIIGNVIYYLPAGQRYLGSVSTFSAAGGGIPSVRGDSSILLKERPVLIVLSQSQEAWGEIVAGYPRGWEKDVMNRLILHGYHVVAKWSTATVLRKAA